MLLVINHQKCLTNALLNSTHNVCFRGGELRKNICMIPPLVLSYMWLCYSGSLLQAVSDIERQWVQATKEQIKHLNTLQQRGSKREVCYPLAFSSQTQQMTVMSNSF